ncbi:hypothetical protein RIF29_41136 [Crotalaria pallida]|uniref:Uncharacterized protein n=1 Tax=Crotalaria pallida TaxID=3830 RepID=A0AAN9E4H0_CROPI
MADSLRQLLRLLGEDPAEDAHPRPRPQPQRYRNRNRNRNHNLVRETDADVVRHNAMTHNPPPHSFNNSGTQNMEGLINNTGYVEGNGNGSIVFGNFDSSTRTFNK